MLEMVITIRGEVDDENEAHRILHYLDDECELHPEDKLIAACKTTQVITND